MAKNAKDFNAVARYLNLALTKKEGAKCKWYQCKVQRGSEW
jgi:hypothetical protein